ncbi:NAD(P)H-hydrate dehydratase [Sphingomonas ginsenosidivorax]|uniref:Bifunctional NAD(P)H-hydrate repair enzyme n=1 Tax=Sphingomonas ginsenosidivorax TaxID=862135 RepID=A0A5C6UHL3_9SPHN|nr:NAD(P)H-hydrate dehydratase [Sphingomonas ginsenosidivorax]TXC71478.1 NAD(P)H-hydrate dehydratase [Sphingomonas ginsenosidivorax]
MIRPEGRPVLTAAQMRAAEEATGESVSALMERAGTAIAVAVRRLASSSEILIVCGPGNNGGDGYVAARVLAERGAKVRVAALGDPKTDAAKAARAGWSGPVEAFADAAPAPILVDALFGTGLTRPLDEPATKTTNTTPAKAGAQLGSAIDSPPASPIWAPAFAGVGTVADGRPPLNRSPAEAGAQLKPSSNSARHPGTPASARERPIVEQLHHLATAAHLTIAIDLPSGLATDTGAALSPPPIFDVTLALGAAKPSHLLQPAARYCGEVRILDIAIPVTSDTHVLDRPDLPTPGPDAHKYTRGMVAIIAGAMPGASDLAALAAMHAGAGYVTLLGDTSGPPHALVRAPFSDHALANDRIGALVVGPGLGRSDEARSLLQSALATNHPLVLDGDALRLLTPDRIAASNRPAILTPHAGEFDALFGKSDADKITRTRAAAKAANAIVVFKGADTVIAAPDGRVRIAPHASDWLSTAGTGDVLAGAIGAMLAARLAPFDAAAAGVWLHADAARRLGPAFIADELALALRKARASL